MKHPIKSISIRLNRVLATLILSTMTMLTFTGTTIGSSEAKGTRRTLPTRHPSVCLRGNMDDGLITWRFVTHQYGVNYYKYSINYQPEKGEGNGNCLDNPKLRIGKLNRTARTCLIAGVVAAPGAFIPGVGWVSSVYTFGTTCAVAIINR